MRASVSAGLTTALAGSTVSAADLFTVYLASGTQRWTMDTADVSYGGTTWTATSPVISWDGYRAATGLEFDAVDLSLAPGALTLDGMTMKLAAVRGSFRGIRVVIQRAYWTTGAVIGAPILFDGTIEEVVPGSTEIRLAVMAPRARLALPVPPRLMSPMCPWQFGDAMCGVSIPTSTPSVTTGTTASVVVLSETQADGFYRMGSLTEGSETRFVTKSENLGATHRVTLDAPLSGAPTGTVTMKRGCTKNRGSLTADGPGCATYSNLARNGSQPDKPRETI